MPKNKIYGYVLVLLVFSLFPIRLSADEKIEDIEAELQGYIVEFCDKIDDRELHKKCLEVKVTICILCGFNAFVDEPDITMINIGVEMLEKFTQDEVKFALAHELLQIGRASCRERV